MLESKGCAYVAMYPSFSVCFQRLSLLSAIVMHQDSIIFAFLHSRGFQAC